MIDLNMLCGDHQLKAGGAVLASYSLLECWFGRTTKTSSNSLLEFVVRLVIRVALSAIRTIKKRKAPNV